MDEGSIAYQMHGADEGSAVVLLHGAAGTRLSWPPQVRRLPGCRLYALDLPGHGNSGEEPCRSIEEYALRLVNWLDALELSDVTLVGHSMGSAIALQVALSEPHRVKALVLVGSAPRLRVTPTLLELASSPQAYIQAMQLIVKWSFSQQAPQRLVELVLERMKETPQPVLLSDLQACDAYDASHRLDAIDARALVVCGSEDRMTPLPQAQVLAEGLKGSRLQVMPQVGHMPMLEQPRAFAALLEGFINGEPRH